MKQFTVKELRRIETEIDNEISHRTCRVSQLRSKEAVSLTAAYTECQTELVDMISKHTELLDSKFAIREIISKFNSDNGINERTGKIAALKAAIQFLEDSVLNIGSATSYAPYGSTKTVYRYGITEDHTDSVRSEIRALKRQIQALTDSCNGINSSHKFAINENLLKVFVKYGLID